MLEFIVSIAIVMSGPLLVVGTVMSPRLFWRMRLSRKVRWLRKGGGADTYTIKVWKEPDTSFINYSLKKRHVTEKLAVFETELLTSYAYSYDTTYRRLYQELEKRFPYPRSLRSNRWEFSR